MKQSATESKSKHYLDKIKSDYIKKKLFFHLSDKKLLKVIKYSKQLQYFLKKTNRGIAQIPIRVTEGDNNSKSISRIRFAS